MADKKLQIRNSIAEFLIFTNQSVHDNHDNIEVYIQNDTVWLSQDLIARLFDVDKSVINKHIDDIYKEHELTKDATYIQQVENNDQDDMVGSFYNLDVVIAIGYRINSRRAVEFRKWAVSLIRNFSIRGYVIDKKRMENGTFFSEDYFERLLEEIREIRLSERNLYKKITDIYSTAMDYDKNATITKKFFAKVQNKFHYAIHGKTAPQLIRSRADANKKHMGLTSWEGSPDKKIVKSDVSIAKNYLTNVELDSLGRLVNGYLEFAEGRAKRRIPMTMEDWDKHLDKMLQADDRELLTNAGQISTQDAKSFAEAEWEKYRIKQDRLFESDFDKEIKAIGEKKKQLSPKKKK